MRDRWGSTSVVVMLALSIGARAAPAQAAPPAAPSDAASRAATEARVQALERELARQAEELDRLRARMEAQESATSAAEASAADDQALAALLAQTQAEQHGGGPAMRLYGFADMGLQRIWASREVRALAPDTDALTFVLGNVNVYFDANVSPSWRFLAEVRFGLGPNGALERPAGMFWSDKSVDTTVSDPSAANGSFAAVRWAGVIPQRAHIDWMPHDAFNLRTGLFLTPYGIWNVDHGTPTRIMATEPLFLGTQMVPTQLLGVEIYGVFPVLPWTLGYHLHVSNGRTFGQVDLTDDKAVGGRLFAETRAPFPLKLGVSWFWGTAENQKRLNPLTRTRTYASKEYAVCGDVSFDAGPLRVRSEVVASWIFYDDDLRPTLLGRKLADTLRMGAYLLAAYQLPWWGLEPLLMFEYFRYPLPRELPVGRGAVLPSVGLNAYFTAATMLRTQFTLARGVDRGANRIDPEGFLYTVAARLITAF